jgi:hypothetical protein
MQTVEAGLNLLDISPLDSERVRNLDISTLLGLGDMES